MKMLQFRHRFQSILLLATLSIGVSLHAAEWDIRSFGAKGDGVSDDTTAIVKAFNVLQQDGGGVLSFGNGKYVFSGLLKIKGLKNSTIDFSGATLLNREQKGSFHFDHCDNLTIHGGILTYREMPSHQQTNDQHPLYITAGNNIRVDNVHILGSPFMGIAINGCRYIWVVNCRIERTMRDGLHFVFSSDIVCTGNQISHTTDDALALIDYGHEEAVRLERAVVSNNIIYNCRQGLVCVGGHDIIFSNNHVQRTTFSGCQITTNDRFNAHGRGVCNASRVKVLGNRFIESGADFEINGEMIRNSGQITTGRAGIVVSYIDNAKGWNRNGDEYFSRREDSVTVVSEGRFRTAANLIEDLFPGRKIQMTGADGQSAIVTVSSSIRKDDQCEFTVVNATEVPPSPKFLKLSRIITDIDISDNEIIDSHVNGIYTNGVYRLRIINNKIQNCNRSASQFTGNIVEVLNGAKVDFLNNWIIDSRTAKLHHKPLTITAAECRNIGTRID